MYIYTHIYTHIYIYIMIYIRVQPPLTSCLFGIFRVLCDSSALVIIRSRQCFFFHPSAMHVESLLC